MLPPARREPKMQTPDIRVLLSHFLRQIEARHVRTSTQGPIALHYDSKTGSLVEYPWPCEPNPIPSREDQEDEFRRVPPGDLEKHRRTHDYLGPSCLCAFLDEKDYTEAQISIVEILTKDEERNCCLLNGEIVAQCAKQRCGYLLCLERFYQQKGIALRSYKRRDIPLPPQDLIHISDIEKSFRRGDGLFQVMPDVISRGNRNGLKRIDPSETKAVQAGLLADLMRGVSESRFWDTFVQCKQCNQVTFREHYAVNHRCSATDHQKGAHSRYHPYRHSSITNTWPTGSRLLARMDTLLSDAPATSPVRSLSAERNDSEHESAYGSDPVDLDFSENGATDFDHDTSQEFHSAVEDATEEVASNVNDYSDVGDVAASSSSEGGSAWPWWLPDAPPLPASSDDLPDLMTILRNPERVSHARTQIEDDE